MQNINPKTTDMKYTKKQRLAIYKAGKKQYLKNRGGHWSGRASMCWSLYNTGMIGKNKSLVTEHCVNKLSEFKLFQPDNSIGFWFENDQERLICFDLMILMTSNK